ncbi:MAG: hypothetical protein KDD11_23070, partial [Acidobacteria bacterium]|nr:hypothetical protein [Acidobacteriota bacterium]
MSALIATSWLEGGVPYRDAIDQRGPVTYVLYALVFLVAGKNDMAAVHWALLLLIFGGCLLVFRVAAELGGTLLRRGGSGDGSSDTTEAEPADAPAEAGTGARRWLLDLPSGYLAAGLVAVCSFTYRRSQMLAFHTEWPVLILSTLGMWWVWRRLEEARRETVPEGRVVGGLFLAGLAFGGAFLSKQPAVFDGAAAGAFLLAWQWHWGRLFTRETVVRAGALAGGFFVALGVCVAYFAAEGALGDFYLYFWQYNVEHYTAVVPVADRIAALDPFLHKRHYLTANPLLLIAVLIAVARAIGALFDRGRRAIDGRLLLVLWFLAAYFGASYSGRNFGHYFIQILAPACLITALLVRELWLRAGRAPGFLGTWAWRGALATVVLVALGLSVYRFRGD